MGGGRALATREMVAVRRRPPPPCCCFWPSSCDAWRCMAPPAAPLGAAAVATTAASAAWLRAAAASRCTSELERVQTRPVFIVRARRTMLAAKGSPLPAAPVSSAEAARVAGLPSWLLPAPADEPAMCSTTSLPVLLLQRRPLPPAVLHRCRLPPGQRRCSGSSGWSSSASSRQSPAAHSSYCSLALKRSRRSGSSSKARRMVRLFPLMGGKGNRKSSEWLEHARAKTVQTVTWH